MHKDPVGQEASSASTLAVAPPGHTRRSLGETSWILLDAQSMAHSGSHLLPLLYEIHRFATLNRDLDTRPALEALLSAFEREGPASEHVSEDPAVGLLRLDAARQALVFQDSELGGGNICEGFGCVSEGAAEDHRR